MKVEEVTVDRIDPRAQRTIGTLGQRVAAGDPEARAQMSRLSMMWLLSGTPDQVNAKVNEFDSDTSEFGLAKAKLLLARRVAANRVQR